MEEKLIEDSPGSEAIEGPGSLPFCNLSGQSLGLTLRISLCTTAPSMYSFTSCLSSQIQAPSHKEKLTDQMVCLRIALLSAGGCPYLPSRRWAPQHWWPQHSTWLCSYPPAAGWCSCPTTGRRVTHGPHFSLRHTRLIPSLCSPEW